MSHVKKAQAYTHWPTGCPKRARMKDPSLHEPSKKVLQMKTWACQACFPRWKPTEGPKHNKPTHHRPLDVPLPRGPTAPHILPDLQLFKPGGAAATVDPDLPFLHSLVQAECPIGSKRGLLRVRVRVRVPTHVHTHAIKGTAAGPALLVGCIASFN